MTPYVWFWNFLGPQNEKLLRVNVIVFTFYSLCTLFNTNMMLMPLTKNNYNELFSFIQKQEMIFHLSLFFINNNWLDSTWRFKMHAIQDVSPIGKKKKSQKVSSWKVSEVICIILLTLKERNWIWCSETWANFHPKDDKILEEADNDQNNNQLFSSLSLSYFKNF